MVSSGGGPLFDEERGVEDVMRASRDATPVIGGSAGGHSHRALTIGLAAILASIAAVLIASGLMRSAPAVADGTGTPLTCVENGGTPAPPATDIEGSLSPGTFNAGAGNTVVYVCIKAGTPHSGPLTMDGYYDAAF